MIGNSRKVSRRTVLGAAAAGLAPMVGGCVGFFGDSSEPPGVFLALDLTDGSKQWERTYDNAIQSGAAVDGETVYIGDDDGYLRALSRTDGSELWSFNTISPAFENHPDGSVPAAVTTDVTMGAGAIYACTDQANVVAVTAEGGEERWRYSLESPYETQMVSTIRATPGIVDETVVFATGSDDGTLYGVDANSGEGKWEITMEGAIESGPATSTDRFFVVDGIGNVRAIATGGETLWDGTISSLTEGAVTVGEDTLYVGSDEGIHALNAGTGEQQWVTDESYWVDSGPVLGDEFVFATTRGGTVAAFDRSGGTQQWHVEVGTDGDASAALADGLIVAGDRDGRVVGLNSTDGSKVWTTDTEDLVTATPLVADETVYIGTK